MIRTLSLVGSLAALAALLWLPSCSDVGSGGSGSSPDVGFVFSDTPGQADQAPTDGSPPPTDTPGSDNPAPPQDGTSDPGPAQECTGCLPPAVCIQGHCVSESGCTAGDTSSCYSETELLTCTANADGATGYIPVDCPPAHLCSDGACKPNVCEPDKWYCEGLGAKKQCNTEGTGFLPVEDCPAEQYCSSGLCGSSCALDPKFGAHAGCFFWTVDLPNYPDPFTDAENIAHAVIVSNPGEMDAEISFEPPPGVVIDNPDPIVPGKGSKAFVMPIMNVQGTSVSDKGVRLTSTRPVIVHQFNPWEHSKAASNDASLLLPENALGSEYYVITLGSGPSFFIEAQNGYFTVLAVYDDTEVTVQVTAHVAAVPGVLPELQKGDTATVTLQRGQVLNVESLGEIADAIAGANDLTGSRITSTKPVAAFSGHEEAVLKSSAGEDSCCAEHLEEQLLPLHLLGQEYLAVHSPFRGGTEPDFWRIVAAQPNVTITTDPPQAGANNVTLANPGDWIEVETVEHFELSATGKVQVGQLMVSQQSTDDWTGDPALTLMIPEEKFRDLYTIQVPSSYAKNYVYIVKPVGVAVSQTSGPVPEADFTYFGSGAWGVAYLELQPGVYIFAGDQPFGLYAAGYDGAVSYGYPGGMDI